MSETTVLDLLHQATVAAPDDDAARVRFYERIADTELFVLLQSERDEADLAPQEFALEDGVFIMAFDRDDRLSAFADAPAPYAAIPGRAVVLAIAGSGTGLGLNVGVAPSSFLMPAAAVDWLADVLTTAPVETEAAIARFLPPRGVPATFFATLTPRLAAMAGLAGGAILANAEFRDGRAGHVLAFVDPGSGAEPALAKAVSEALAFSGVDAGSIDVIFVTAGSTAARAIGAVGQVIELPQPARPESVKRSAGPGTDPDRPPRLK